jgi:hypothetical protein
VKNYLINNKQLTIMKRIEKENAIIAYKGFDKNLCCRGYQYEAGKEYHANGDIRACSNGFHACPNPNDLFAYYAPNEGNRYCKVKLWGDVDDSESDKIAASDIEIIEEMSIMEVANVKRIFTENNAEDKECNTGNYSSASNTGDKSSASNTGYKSSASNTGYKSSASNTGNYSSASNTGYKSSASNTGNYSSESNTGYKSSASNTGYKSSASNTGDKSSASNTGNYSSASNTGNYSSASNTGDYSSADVSGKASCAAVFGKDSKVRGAIGCALFLVERGEWDDVNEVYPIINVLAVIVDGEEIKADTWYKLVNGKLVEVEE